MIEGLLKTPSPDGEERRTIAVATGCAYSAAADLLINADYAVAYPSAAIHCHGTRFRPDQDVTVETANRYVDELRGGNQERAHRLAQSSFRRVLFLFQLQRPQFEEIRKQHGAATDVECFWWASLENLSRSAAHLSNEALQQQEEISSMSQSVIHPVGIETNKNLSLYEAGILRRIISYELRRKRKKTGWSLSTGGIDDIARDFKLVQDYHLGSHTETLRELVVSYKDFFFTPEDQQQLIAAKLSSEETEVRANTIVHYRMAPLWYYTLFLCRLLMERENPLSPLDAFWLGLIDEVAGQDLPTLRKAVEQAPTTQDEVLKVGS